MPLKFDAHNWYLIRLYIYVHTTHTHMYACMYLLVVCVYYTYIIIITYYRQFLFGHILSEHQSLANPSSNHDLNWIFLTFFYVIVHTTWLYIKPFGIFSVFLSRTSANAAEVTNWQFLSLDPFSCLSVKLSIFNVESFLILWLSFQFCEVFCLVPLVFQVLFQLLLENLFFLLFLCLLQGLF